MTGAQDQAKAREEKKKKIEQEAAFFDSTLARLRRYPRYDLSLPLHSSYHRHSSLMHGHLVQSLGEVKGKKVLVLGCGVESSPFWFALRGARVTAIDIRSKAVAIVQDAAQENGLDNLAALVMDAEELAFPDRSFDIIYGAAVLHHLTTRKIALELQRVLTAQGRGVFGDVLGINPVLTLFRRLTPGSRTPWEHPLTRNDLDLYRQHFRQVQFRGYCFLSIPYFFVVQGLFKKYYPRIVHAFSRMDEALLGRFPALHYHCWICTLTLRP
jgi:ubiquinone/menaquinone biosynthesis C-methylase UbiE